MTPFHYHQTPFLQPYLIANKKPLWKVIFASALIILGSVALLYRGSSDKESMLSNHISPIIAGIVLAGGVLLFAFREKSEDPYDRRQNN
jgi:hypothetical protein